MEVKQIKKYSGKTIPQLIKKATEVFNKHIRTRDSKEGMFTCISCNKLYSKESMHAGHYLSAGHNGSVRFDERNVNGQCVRCNTFLHGNAAEYRKGLIRKIGLEEVESLEEKSKMRGFKWDRYGLIEIITKYK